VGGVGHEPLLAGERGIESLEHHVRILAIAAVVLGWLLSGRALRPVRSITDEANR
jgi:hypothetical protein